MNIHDDHKNLFNRLSNELLVEILSHIPHDNFKNIRLVDRRFKETSYTASLWEKVRTVNYSKLFQFL